MAAAAWPASRQTRFDLWMHHARLGLEGVLFVMARDSAHSKGWSIFGMLVDFVQLLAYPLYSGESFPWFALRPPPPLCCLPALPVRSAPSRPILPCLALPPPSLPPPPGPP